MKSRPVDERASNTEYVATTYWVWLFTRPRSAIGLEIDEVRSWTSDVRELTECDVEDAIAYGSQHSEMEAFAVAVAERTDTGVSLTWVRGFDLNDEPLDPAEERARRRMLGLAT